MASGLRINSREAAGAAGLILALAAASLGTAPAAMLLQPLAGTFYALGADGLLQRRRGASPWSAEPQALVWMATLSIFLWIAFEALNAERGLWAYLGWPADELLRYAALGWFFATILPSIALTAELLGGDAAWRKRREPSGLAAALGLALFAAAGWGPLPGEDSRLLAGGVVALYLVGGGPAYGVGRQLAGSAAGLGWIGATEAVNRLADGQRALVAPDGFAPVLWLAAALLGPALGGLYQQAADRLGLPCWPPREGSTGFDTIKLG